MANLPKEYDNLGGDAYSPSGGSEDVSLAEMRRIMDEEAGVETGLMDLIKNNPGLATAVGLGTAGLGYGAYRALS